MRAQNGKKRKATENGIKKIVESAAASKNKQTVFVLLVGN